MFPAFAADATAGETLKSYGLLQGNSDGDLNEEGTITRAEMMTVLARLLKVEDEAKAYEIPSGFTDIENHWNKNVIAYAKYAKWTTGVTETTFAPDAEVNEAQAATFILRALGYPAEIWETAKEEAKTLGIDTSVVNADTVKRGEVFEMALKALDKPVKGTEQKLGASLGIEAYTKPVEPVVEVAAVKVKSATSINSKAVEVVLSEAGTKVDETVFTVTDKDAKAIAVTKAEFAPWATDKKTVLVTVETDLAAGTLYSIKSGETTANFGGVSKDETKPTVTKVTSTDYNEVTIEFSEAVMIDGLTITAAEKYEGKADLAISEIKYSANNKLTLTTADQKESTLYATVIKGAKDLAGNAMEDEESKTFTGTKKSTAKQTVSDAKTTDSVTVEVTFGEKVDATTAVEPTNFVVTEKYGTGTIEVTKAVVMADDDVTAGNEGKVVELTLATDTKDATLYQLEVKNVGTKYGVAIDTDNDTDTFTGKAKDSDAPDTLEVTAVSNTEIKVAFKKGTAIDKLAADADHSLVTIKEKVSGAALEVTFKEVKDNYITFTAAALKSATLYEATVAKGIADKAGNVTKDELKDTFVGKGVDEKISTVSALNTANKGTELTVTFDVNHGEGALDVGSYFIDGGIGYPTKVEAHDTNDKAVVLTINDTAQGDLYELTVKNVKNSDGVAMDSKGLTCNFVGTGSKASAKAKVEAAVATDEQTLKVYFDKKVDDIDGLVNSSDELTGTVKIIGSGTTTLLAASSSAYVDPTNAKVLIISAPAASFDDTNDNTSGTYHVEVVATGVSTTAGEFKAEFAHNNTDPTKIKIEGVVALNAQTLRVYFNQPVRNVADTGFITVDHDGASGTAAVATATAEAANTNKTQWDFGLSAANKLTSTGELTVTVATTPGANLVSTHDATWTKVGFSAETADQTAKFAGSTEAAGYVSDVSAVMKDAKTIVIYFPEKMYTDTATAAAKSAISAANFAFYTDSAATTLVTMNATGTPNFSAAAHVAKTAYDTDDNSVTITLNEKFVSGTSSVYVKVANTVANVVDTKTVKKDSTTDVVTEMAVSTKDADKVTIDTVTVSGQVITIKLSQAATAATELETAAEFVKAITLKVNGSATTLTSNDVAIVAKDASGNDVTDTTANAVKTLIVTVSNVTLTANQAGEADFGTTNDLTGINGEKQDADAAAVIFVQK
jgi:hypothetical protein